MADNHPFAAHRAHKVERERIGHITKGYASGGAVHDDEKEDRKLVSKMLKDHDKRDGHKIEGRAAGGRIDRAPRRAKGGRVKSKGTNVNVIVAPQQHPGMGAAPGAGAPAPAAIPPHPPPMPMAGPLGAPPPGLGGPPGMPPGAPPMMPPRKRGGRVTHGPAWKEGRHAGTQPQNNPSGKNEKPSDFHDKPPLLTRKATGGAVEVPRHDRIRLSGGDFSEGKPHGPKFTGGNSGVGRLQKLAHVKKHYP